MQRPFLLRQDTLHRFADRFTVALILLMLLSLAPTQLQAFGEEIKTIQESFDYASGDWVDVENKMGELQVITEKGRRQVEVVIVIRADARDRDDALEILERLQAGARREGNRILIRADLESRIKKMSQDNDQRKITFTDGAKVKVRDFSVDMEIRMPEEANLHLQHRFGNASVGDLSGSYDLLTEYGELTLGRLPGSGKLHVSFGEARVSEMARAEVHLSYGNLDLKQGGDLQVNATFSELEAGSIKELRLRGSYNDYSFHSVEELDVEEVFSNMQMDRLHNTLSATLEYGSLRIDHVEDGFSELVVSMSLGDVQLGVSQSSGFRLEVETELGELDLPTDKLRIQTQEKNLGSHKLVADYGDGEAKLRVNMKFGKLDLNLVP